MVSGQEVWRALCSQTPATHGSRQRRCCLHCLQAPVLTRPAAQRLTTPAPLAAMLPLQQVPMQGHRLPALCSQECEGDYFRSEDDSHALAEELDGSSAM